MENLQTSLEHLQTAFKGTEYQNDRSRDLLILGQKVHKSVHDFLVSNSLATPGDPVLRADNSVSVEDIASTVGSTNLTELMESAQIPSGMQEACAEQIGLIMHKYFDSRTGGSQVLAYHQQEAQVEGLQLQDLNSLFSDNLAHQLTGQTEGFGQFVNTTVPDLETAITVTIMRFHMGLLPRIMPTRTTTQPAAIFKVPRMSVFDLADSSASPKPFIDLFEDPGMVSNDLPKIIPLNSNDTDDVYLVEDSLIRFDANAPLLDLSIDATKYGHTQTNHTDTVADGAYLKAVRVNLNLSGGADDNFHLVIPRDVGRLTRMANSEDSGDRTLNVTREYYIHGDTLVHDSESGSDVFAAAQDDEGVKVTVMLNVFLNLKNGVIHGLGTSSVERWHASGDPEDISGDWGTALGSNDDNISVSLLGYEMDARHSEENLRKSSIAVREDWATLAYEIPLGRHYIFDSPLSGEYMTNAPATLARTTNLGEDHAGITCLIDSLDCVADQIQDASAGLSNGNIGRRYAAGSMVRPTVITGTLTITDLKTRRDGERTGDVQQRVKSYLTSITTRIQANSFLQEQIAAGNNVTYRLATDVNVLGCVLGQPHTYQHLDSATRQVEDDGVEFRLVLDNGIVLEVVTTNFSLLRNRMVLTPYIKEDSQSVLNGASNFDMGTVVGQFTNTQNNAHRRSFSHARQQVIPTNPVGAIIDVVGAYAVLQDSLAES